MNNNILSTSLPFDTPTGFATVNNERASNLIVEQTAYVNDLVVAGRIAGAAKVITVEEAPSNATQASLELGVELENNAFTVTAVEPGQGRVLSGLIFSPTLGAEITTSSDDTFYTITVPHDGNAYTSTVAQVISAINTAFDGVLLAVNVGASDGSAVLSAAIDSPYHFTDGSDATGGQLGTVAHFAGIRYEITSLDAYNNPVWEKTSPIYIGTPTNAIAGVKATKETTIGASKIKATAYDDGTAGNSLTIEFLDAGVPNASLAVVQNDTATEVTLATDDGGPAVHVLSVGAGGGTKTITTTLDTDGPEGNDWTLEVLLPTKADPMGGTIPSPSTALAATVDAGEILVKLATTAGVVGVLTLTEDVSGTPGTVTVTQKAAYAGLWGANVGSGFVKGQIVTGAPSGALAVSCVSTTDTLTITITLGMTAGGVPDDAKNTAALITSAINTALATVTGENAGDWTAYLLAETAAAGVFNSTAALTSMASAADAVRVNGSSNQADEVAAVIGALDGIATSVVGAGAGNEEVAITAAANFTTGGDGYVSTSTCAEVVAAIEALETKPILTSVSDGPGTDVIPLNQSDIELTGGINLTPASPGFLAINDTTLYVKVTVDGTPTTWVALTPVA